MIAKRLRTGLVALGLVALGMVVIELAPSVRAEDPPPRVMPHGKYGANTKLCAVCHDWHIEPDQDLYPDTLASFPWEQLLTEPSELELCYTCHDGSGADKNVERDFGVDTRKSFHPVLAPADDILLACSDCHAQHQDPANDVKLLYRETSPGIYLFSPPSNPIGDTFCYGCHGDNTLPAPFGDHSAFETSIHDDSASVVPPTNGTDLKCSVCHAPHASDYRYLTRGNEEELCYTCHASAGNSAKGSIPRDDFTAVANDYSTSDADGMIRIYHHPVADSEQDDGARVVECASCHNSHLVDRVYTVSDPNRARAMDSGRRFNWSSGYNRSPYAAEFCGTCHADPTDTTPLLPVDPVLVPYDVTLVNDAGDDPDGEPHDTFDYSRFTSGVDSAHGNPAYDSTDYEGCPPSGNCQLACTACHDFHGSSNAYMLREDIDSPDYRPLAVTSATWTAGQGIQPGTAALTVGPHGIAKDWIVTVTGMNPIGYNGVWTVAAVTATTISFELATNPGAFVTGGTLDTGGPYNRSYRATIVNFGGQDIDSDRNKLQTFCITCHLEWPSGLHPVTSGTLCTSCHNHAPSSSAPF